MRLEDGGDWKQFFVVRSTPFQEVLAQARVKAPGAPSKPGDHVPKTSQPAPKNGSPISTPLPRDPCWHPSLIRRDGRTGGGGVLGRQASGRL